MRSPPTSRTIAARSSVVVTTFNFPCACTGAAATIAAMTSARTKLRRPIKNSKSGSKTQQSRMSERVCTVRPDRKLELEQEFVGRLGLRVAGAPVLATDLAEFARPVGQHR